MKCHEAAAADNVTGRRSGGPPRPEGISSPAAAFLRSLEPSVGFDKKFRFGLLTKILCCALCTMKQNEAKAKKMSGCRCLQMCCVLPMIERFTCFTLYCFFFFMVNCEIGPQISPSFSPRTFSFYHFLYCRLSFCFLLGSMFKTVALLLLVCLYELNKAKMLILSRFLPQSITPNLVVVSFFYRKK